MTVQELIRFGFQLLGRTFLKGWLLNLIVFVPLILLFNLATRRLLPPFADLIVGAGANPEKAAALMELFLQQNREQIFGFNMAVALLFVGIVWVTTATTIMNWHHVIGENEGLGAVLRRSFGRPLLMTLVQTILLTVAFGIAWFIGFAVTNSLPGVLPAAGLAFLIAIFSFLGAAVSFRIHEIVADDRGPWRGLVSAVELARVNILRVVSFVVGLGLLLAVVSSGLTLGIAWLRGGEGSSAAAADTSTPAGSAAVFRQMAAELTPMSAVAQGVFYSLITVFFISMLTALYTDMRARRGDFAPEMGDDDTDLPDAYRAV